MANEKLTTLIDAVGIHADGTACCIEVKTCRLAAGVYAEYADSPCSRTPMLRCTPALANTERQRHSLQAAFGAACLATRLARPCKAYVVVLCKGGQSLAYMVPSRYQMATRFARLMRVPQRAAPATPRRRGPSKGPQRAPWPAGVDACAAACGVQFRAKSLRARVRDVVRGRCVVGIVLHDPGWAAAPQAHRLAVLAVLKRHAARHVSAHHITPMVVCPHGGSLQLVMAGAPFKPRSV